MIVSWIKYGKPSLSLTLNGILAGLVGVTAGCDLVPPMGAALIGAICGTVMIFAVEFIEHRLKIDDPVGASSVHGVCGSLGTILTGLFAVEGGTFSFSPELASSQAAFTPNTTSEGLLTQQDLARSDEPHEHQHQDGT